MAEISDRNLLFGILAIQLDFIDSEQLVEAANAWMLEKTSSLGEILVKRGSLPVDDKQFIDKIVDKHIAKSGSPKQSLQRLQEFGSSIQTEQIVHRLRNSDSDVAGNSTLEAVTQDHEHESDGFRQVSPLRYRIVRALARGGLGRVSVARDIELDREVALKEILEEKASSFDARDRFMLEAKITGSLEHPGIVPVYGLGIGQKGSPYYAMRLIRGKSLHLEIQNLYKSANGELPFAKLDQTKLRRLLRSVVDACNAVGYAHSRGVLHRDLKPSNIMIGKYGETLVVDWGLAKVLGDPTEDRLQSEPVVVDSRPNDSSLTTMGSVVGSPGYMSPEQANGRLDLLDFRTDVFCLGACLYAVLTGKALFRGSTREETLEAARACDFSAPREFDATIPKSLEAVCLKALAKTNDNRYGSALELAEDIDRWIAGEPVTAMEEPVWQRAGRWAKQHQTLVASTIVLFVVSFLGLVISNRVISGERDTAQRERDRANDLKVIADRATVLALKERDNAKELRLEADESKKIAQSNSKAMSEVLDKFVKELADKWSEFPGFEKERIEMVQLAVERVARLLNESPNDVELRKHLINLNIRLAQLYRMTGDANKSKQTMDYVLELCEVIPLNSSDNCGIVGDALAQCINVIEEQQPAAQLEPYVRNSLDVSRKRFALDPDNWLTQLAMTRALVQQAEFLIRMQKYDEARMACKEAIAIAAAHIESPHTFIEPLFHFFAYHLDGKAALLGGDLREAEKQLNLALSYADKCNEKYKDNNNVMQFRQSVIIDIAVLEFAKDNASRGFELLEESKEVFVYLVDNWQDTIGYKRLLADLQLSMAEKYVLSGQLEKATSAAAEANKIIDNYPGKEFVPAHVLPLQLRSIAVALRLAGDDVSDSLRDAYLQARTALESFDPQDRTLKDVFVPKL